MKKILIVLLLIISFSSCNTTPIKTYDGIKYTVIDTVNTDVTSIGYICGYDVIIKIDSTYYSAILTRDKKLDYIVKELKHITSKK